MLSMDLRSLGGIGAGDERARGPSARREREISRWVLTEVVDGVLAITINRPEVRNAINTAAAEGIGGSAITWDGAGADAKTKITPSMVIFHTD
jgi:hypothetical protein